MAAMAGRIYIWVLRTLEPFMGLEAAQRGETNAPHASRRSSQSKKSENSLGKVAKNTPEHTYSYEWQDLLNQSPGATVLSAYQAMADHSPRVQQLMALQALADQAQRTPTRAASETLQLVPATAKGSTHLVERKNKSIMMGKSVSFIESGTSLDVQRDQRVISRRGPNQELVGSYDLRGDHIYRWYKVNQVNDKVFKDNVFIREGTFYFCDKSPLEFAHNLGHSKDKRSRQSHVAIKLVVWHNKDRNIDKTGHMVMEDYSASHRGKDPIYEYTWDNADPNITLEDKKIISGENFYNDNYKDNFHHNDQDINVHNITNKDIDVPDRNNGVLTSFRSKHKTLKTKNESRDVNEKTQKEQKRYFKTGANGQNTYTINPPRTLKKKEDTSIEEKEDPSIEEKKDTSIKRFDKINAVELLVTQDEYNYIMNLYNLRQQHGFYCFLREARTYHGYDMATRCLSFLEDVAIKRKQYSLTTGHAADVLEQFAQLNEITTAHKFEKDVTL